MPKVDKIPVSNKLKIQGSFSSSFNLKLRLSSHKVVSCGILGLLNYEIYQLYDCSIVTKRFFRGWIRTVPKNILVKHQGYFFVFF